VVDGDEQLCSIPRARQKYAAPVSADADSLPLVSILGPFQVALDLQLQVRSCTVLRGGGTWPGDRASAPAQRDILISSIHIQNTIVATISYVRRYDARPVEWTGPYIAHWRPDAIHETHDANGETQP
jgi:hypothetical protein